MSDRGLVGVWERKAHCSNPLYLPDEHGHGHKTSRTPIPKAHPDVAFPPFQFPSSGRDKLSL